MSFDMSIGNILFWIFVAVVVIVFVHFVFKAGTVGILTGIRDFRKAQQRKERQNATKRNA